MTAKLQSQPGCAGRDLGTGTMTMIANEIKKKQFNSEHEMHLVQKMVGVPSSKLISGEDVRSAVQQRNKKEYQNHLRYVLTLNCVLFILFSLYLFLFVYISAVLNASKQTALQDQSRRNTYDEDIRRATMLSLRTPNIEVEDLTEDTPPQPPSPDERKPAAVSVPPTVQ